jgi:hypothetical protein
MLDALERTNVNGLSDEEKQALTQKTYEKVSYFNEKFRRDQINFSCQPISLLLRKQLERLLHDKKIINKDIDQDIELENLHERLSDEMRAYDFHDGVNKISTYFYETDKQFIDVYHQLIRLIRSEIIQEPFLFQATPTIRFHSPNALNSNHYPRYHSDLAYGHPPEEINFWIPLTELYGSQGHGFRLMDLAQSKKILEQFNYSFPAFIDKAIKDRLFSNACDELAPHVRTAFGEVLAFDSRCVHSGEPLQLHTRISIDIRILPLSQYQTMSMDYQGTGRRKILFVPGSCYHEKDSDHF